MFDLFGSEMPLPAKFFIAFATVLALIGVTAWLVRRFGANRLGGGNTRGRQPRLAVIDAATVDGRRRLVLIRRDNVEHLLMIGGPTDVVVEPNIVRAAASRDAPRDQPRVETPRTGEPTARQVPPVENAWPLQPVVPEPPPPAAPQRPYRASSTEEPWLAPEPGARPRPADSSLAGLAVELSSRLNPPEPAVMRNDPPVRNDPPLRPGPPPPILAVAPVTAPAVATFVTEEPVAPPQTDHNLAEMAQQLEAALRRTPVPEGRPPVTDPLAVPPKPARDYKLRVDPQFVGRQEARAEPNFESKPDAKVEPKFDSTFEPNFDLPPEPKLDKPLSARPPEPKPPQAKPPAARPQAAADKSIYDSLEEEMANLLGRPPGKT